MQSVEQQINQNRYSSNRQTSILFQIISNRLKFHLLSSKKSVIDWGPISKFLWSVWRLNSGNCNIDQNLIWPNGLNSATPFLSSFFSLSRLSPTATALSFSRFTRWLDEWTSLFSTARSFFLDLGEDNFCSLFLLLWISWGHYVGFSAKRDLLERILWKLKLAAARFTTSTLITFYHWKNFCRCRGLNPGLHSLTCLWCIYCKAALMQTWKLDNSSSRWGYRPSPLRFHVKEAGADAKLTQNGPLGVSYHRRHPISTVPVERITAHATVPAKGHLFSLKLDFCLPQPVKTGKLSHKKLSRDILVNPPPPLWYLVTLWLTPPSPLKCHVFFEWPLIVVLETQQETCGKEIKMYI